MNHEVQPEERQTETVVGDQQALKLIVSYDQDKNECAIVEHNRRSKQSDSTWSNGHNTFAPDAHSLYWTKTADMKPKKRGNAGRAVRR